jgi:RNA polymerase sigma factor (sigma-70 family)
MRDDRPAAESTFHLLERARAGDQEATNRLFARHVRPLQRWASGRLPKWARDVADTDDLVQETLLQTFKRIGQFESRGVGALHAYLRQAVLNRIREELRRKSRRPDGTSLSGLEAESHLSPLEQAIGGEALERYERALAWLTANEQDVIVGRVELGYTYEELAQALGKPTADAARKASQRALIRLVEEMERCNK